MADYVLTASSWDEPDGDGGFRRHRRGDLVTLDPSDAERLLRAGALIPVADHEPNHDDISLDEVRGRHAEKAAATSEPEPEPDDSADAVDDADEPSASVPERPRRAGSRADWYAYALATGVLTAAQAEDLTKAQIISAVESH